MANCTPLIPRWWRLVSMVWMGMVLGCLGLAAASSTGSTSRSADQTGLSLVGVQPDPFVTAAPLIVGAVCSEGVVLVALHTAFAEEPLMLDAQERNTTRTNTSDTNTSDTNTNSNTGGTNATSTRFQDLPRSYRGPFRIHSVDGIGSALVCSGWRAHGQLVTNLCRSMANEEHFNFGPAGQAKEYGQYIASETSLRMAYSAVHDGKPLSCVGLLACCHGSSRSKNTLGYLWLVDATGAYRVRAHAVGGGALLAGLVNQHLNDMDLASSTAEDIIRQLLDLLGQQDLPEETRVELAVVGLGRHGKQRLKRVFVSHLFGVSTSLSIKSSE